MRHVFKFKGVYWIVPFSNMIVKITFYLLLLSALHGKPEARLRIVLAQSEERTGFISLLRMKWALGVALQRKPDGAMHHLLILFHFTAQASLAVCSIKKPDTFISGFLCSGDCSTPIEPYCIHIGLK